jgi:hypothetical protein
MPVFSPQWPEDLALARHSLIRGPTARNIEYGRGDSTRNERKDGSQCLRLNFSTVMSAKSQSPDHEENQLQPDQAGY